MAGGAEGGGEEGGGEEGETGGGEGSTVVVCAAGSIGEGAPADAAGDLALMGLAMATVLVLRRRSRRCS